MILLVQVTRPSLIGGDAAEDQQKQAEFTKHSSVEAQLKDRLILLRQVSVSWFKGRVIIMGIFHCLSLLRKRRHKVIFMNASGDDPT